MPASAVFKRALVALPLLLVAALALTLLAAAPADAAGDRERKIRRATQIAINQIGDPYRYGAHGPHAFDCSGLTMFSAKRAGLFMPRSSDAQYRHVRHIPKTNLRRGDYMFFHNGGNVYHVAIFLQRVNGRVQLLHASRSGTPVKRDFAWTQSWFAGTLRYRH